MASIAMAWLSGLRHCLHGCNEAPAAAWSLWMQHWLLGYSMASLAAPHPSYGMASLPTEWSLSLQYSLNPNSYPNSTLPLTLAPTFSSSITLTLTSTLIPNPHHSHKGSPTLTACFTYPYCLHPKRYQHQINLGLSVLHVLSR